MYKNRTYYKAQNNSCNGRPSKSQPPHNGALPKTKNYLI